MSVRGPMDYLLPQLGSYTCLGRQKEKPSQVVELSL